MSREQTQFKPGESGNRRGRPKGLPNKATREFKRWAERFFTDATYRGRLEKRLLEGKAPQLEVYMYQMLYGKPTEQLEVSDRRTIPDSVSFILRRATDGPTQDT
jgi:hypothetical protein